MFKSCPSHFQVMFKSCPSHFKVCPAPLTSSLTCLSYSQTTQLCLSVLFNLLVFCTCKCFICNQTLALFLILSNIQTSGIVPMSANFMLYNTALGLSDHKLLKISNLFVPNIQIYKCIDFFIFTLLPIVYKYTIPIQTSLNCQFNEIKEI